MPLLQVERRNQLHLQFHFLKPKEILNLMIIETAKYFLTLKTWLRWNLVYSPHFVIDPEIAPTANAWFLFTAVFMQQDWYLLASLKVLSSQVNWTHPFVSSQSNWHNSGELVLAWQRLRSLPGASEFRSKHRLVETKND